MRGAARLHFRGLLLEKYLERAMAAGVVFLSVARTGPREAEMCVSQRDAKTLLEMARRYSLDVRLVRQSGCARLRDWCAYRATLLPALLFGAGLALWLLSRVWVVEAGEAAIGAALNELGVQPGLRAESLDTDELARQLQIRLPEYAYIAAKRTGVRLFVEAVRELPAPDVYDPLAARDLVAKEDGVLLRLDVLVGRAAVKIGDTVKRGQVLIRGEERVKGEETRGVCALGTAVARCYYEGVCDASLTEMRRVPTGRVRTETTIECLDWSHALNGRGEGAGERFASYETTVERVPVGGLLLPLHVVRVRIAEVVETCVALDIEAVKDKISRQALDMALEKAPEGCLIVDKWTDYSMIEKDGIRVRAVVEAEQNIAVSTEAYLAGGED